MSGFLAFGLILLIVYYTIRSARVARKGSKIEYIDPPGLMAYEIDFEENDAVYFRELVNTLKKDFPFYNRLGENERRKFATRTFQIRKSKNFYGMESFTIEAKHEIIISATLAKLTFGISNRFELPMFEMIQIYPEVFYSKLLDTNVKGLTIGNGRIFLSWKDFESGMADHDDKIHVGLHEFAHAMMIEFDHFRYVEPWKIWMSHANQIMLEVRQNENHFFRKYGGTNIHEFWAVTIETFFEQPKEFRTQYQSLYDATSAILNQDPCARMEIFESI